MPATHLLGQDDHTGIAEGGQPACSSETPVIVILPRKKRPCACSNFIL